MNRFIALFFSALFHPVFVNTLGLYTLLLLSSHISPSVRYFYIAFVFITAALIPLIAVIIMKLLGNIKSILLDDQDERNIPYLITSFMYLFDYYFLSKLQAPAIVKAYVLACACIVVAVVVINHFYKISIHGASLGAFVGILIALNSYLTIDMRFITAIAFIVSGLVLSSRLFLSAHILSQVVTGWLLGFMLMYIILA